MLLSLWDSVEIISSLNILMFGYQNRKINKLSQSWFDFSYTVEVVMLNSKLG